MADRKIISTKKQLEDFIKDASERDEAKPKNGEPGLFFLKLKRGGAWRLRYTDAHRNRRTFTIADHSTSPTEASQLAAAWKEKIKRGDDPFTLKEKEAEQRREEDQVTQQRRYLQTRTFFTDIYTPALIHHAGTKAAQTTCNIIRMEFAHLFDRDMDTLTVHDVRSWENARREEGISRATLQRNYAAFKAMLSYAAGKKKGHVNDHPILQNNPLKDVHLTKPSAEERQTLSMREQELKRSRDLLSAETLKQIQEGLNALDKNKREGRRNSRAHGKPHLPDLDNVAFAHWFVPFAHVARLTGMRPGDILKLQWQNIQTSIRTRGQVLSFRPSKTKHNEKPVDVNFPIVGELLEVLTSWQAQQNNPKSGPVFPAKSGKIMNDKVYHRHWHEVKRLGGVDPDLDFYSFRHNFISDKVARGWPLLRIAKLVGHKDAGMIAEHYFHDDTDDLADLLAAIEGDTMTERKEASA